MEVRTHESIDEFRAVAEPLYRRDPVLNTVELTLVHGGRLPTNSLLLSVWADGAPIGAALQTPPYPLVCNGLPLQSHHRVVTELGRIRPDLTSVRGGRELALSFAAAWCAVTGRAGTVTTEERLYRLATLQSPADVSGMRRYGTDADDALLVDWVEQFFVEAVSHQRDEAAGQRFVDNAKAVGDRFVLWDDGGVPVSMAMLRSPAAGVSRIGPVFTPQNSRGRGYGSAVTAAAAGCALEADVDDVVLFADLANPTSNGIYQRIGFEAVTDSVRIDFGDDT